MLLPVPGHGQRIFKEDIKLVGKSETCWQQQKTTGRRGCVPFVLLQLVFIVILQCIRFCDWCCQFVYVCTCRMRNTNMTRSDPSCSRKIHGCERD